MRLFPLLCPLIVFFDGVNYFFGLFPTLCLCHSYCEVAQGFVLFIYLNNCACIRLCLLPSLCLCHYPQLIAKHPSDMIWHTSVIFQALLWARIVNRYSTSPMRPFSVCPSTSVRVKIVQAEGSAL